MNMNILDLCEKDEKFLMLQIKLSKIVILLANQGIPFYIHQNEFDFKSSLWSFTQIFSKKIGHRLKDTIEHFRAM